MYAQTLLDQPIRSSSVIDAVKSEDELRVPFLGSR
jgi:hypothetical protein